MKNFKVFAAVLSIALVSTVGAQEVSLVVQATGDTYEAQRESLEQLGQEVDALVDQAEKDAAAIRDDVDKKKLQLEQAGSAKDALEADKEALEKALLEAREGSSLHVLLQEKEAEYESAVTIVATDASDENRKKKSEAQSSFLEASEAYNNAKAQVEQLKGALVERHKLAAGVDILAAINSRIRELQGEIADLNAQVTEAEGLRAGKSRYVDALQKRAARVASELEKLDREQLVALGMHNAQVLQRIEAESQKGNAKLDGIGKVSIEVRDEIKEVNTNLVSIQKQNLELLTTLGTMKVQDESLGKEVTTLVKIVREGLAKYPNDEKKQAAALGILQSAQAKVQRAAPATAKPAQATPVRNTATLNSSANYTPPRQAPAPAVCLDQFGRPIVNQYGQPVTNCNAAWYNGN